MARGTKTKENNYKDFDIMAENGNNFTGRIWTDGKTYDTGKSYGISITINDVSIKGAKLWVPDDENKNASFMMPSYKDKDGNYVPYIGFFDKEIAGDVTSIANKLADMI